MPRKQDSGWIGDFLDSPLGLVMQGVGKSQIHDTPGGKNIRLKSSLGHGEDFIEAAILNDIRRRNRATKARSSIPVRPAGLEQPEPGRKKWVSVKDPIHEPPTNPELVEDSLRALLGGSSRVPMSPGSGVRMATQHRVPQPFALPPHIR